MTNVTVTAYNVLMTELGLAEAPLDTPVWAIYMNLEELKNTTSGLKKKKVQYVRKQLKLI